MPHRIAAAVLLFGVAAGAPAQAAKGTTTFDPEFLLAYGYTDNLALGGGGSGEQQQVFDDNFLRLDVRLPLGHRWKTGRLDLNYRPRALWYDTFDELDRVDHFLDFTYDDAPGRKSKLEMRINASASQLQGLDGEDPGNAFLSRRTDRQYYRGDIIYRQGFANLWRWSAIATARLYRYEDIAGLPPAGGNDSQVEDRDAWMLGFQVDKKLSTRTFLGGRYERSNFTLERSGDADTDALLVTYERSLDRRSDLEFTAGIFTTKGTAVLDTSGGEASDRSNGVQGDATYSRRYEHFNLRVRALHRPSAGGALLGAVTFSTVQVTLGRSKAAAAWRWSVSPRWAYRDPLDDTQSNRQTWSISGTVIRRIVGNLSVRFRTNYIDQVGDDVADRDVWSSDIGFAWAPWRGTRIAER